jgi:uncharacterized protein (DUF1501 family)
MDRRYFLNATSLSMAALGFAPSFLRAASADAPKSNKTFVLIFLRGAADGLSLVPPVGESRYFDLRPSIKLENGGDDAALKLDGFFGLHPALSGLMPFWEEGTMAPIHAVGSPDPTRSHFDAQDYWESGTPGKKNTDDGTLNRALQSLAGKTSSASPSAFQAIALQPNLPRILQGPSSALAMASLDDFQIRGGSTPGGGFEGMYRQALDETLRGAGREAFDALGALKSKDPRKLQVENGATYPNSALGKRLREIAQLIKSDLGLRVAVTDQGGWDTHVNQGNAKGQLSNRLKDYGDSVAAFLTDLKSRRDEICLLTVTEFGRTVRENGTRGTDHGHGSVAFVLGGGVKGKRVIANWKGLKDDQLFEGRDLPVTTDYRDLMGELLAKHLGVRDFKTVFPGFDANPKKWCGVLRT